MISLFAGIMKPEDIKKAIERQIVHMEEELEMIECCDGEEQTQQDTTLDVEQAEVFQRAGEWAQNYGRTCVQAGIDYLKTYGVELVALAEERQAANLVSSEKQAS